MYVCVVGLKPINLNLINKPLTLRHMKKYSVLMPDFLLVNFPIDATEEQILSFIYKQWKRFSDSSSFENWADELNELDEYEGTFTPLDAVDNLVSNFHLLINRSDIGAHEFSKMIIERYINQKTI